MEAILPDGIIARESRSQAIDSYSLVQLTPPKAVKLEASSICNFKCSICYNKSARHIGMLSPKDFEIALANIVELKVAQVGILFLGESTLNPHLVEYVARLKSAGIEYVFLTTNGLLADKNLVQQLIDAGLNSLKWSMNYYSADSFSEETGQQYIGFFQVLENIKAAKTMRDVMHAHMRLYASCVISSQASNEQNAFINMLHQHVDEVVINSKTNQGGLTDNKPCTNLKSNMPCPRLFNNMYVRSNLDVVCCCNGFTDDFKIGSLRTSTLKQLWNCKQMMSLRKAHLHDNGRCSPCSFKLR